MTFALSLVSVAMAPLAIERMSRAAPRNERPVLILIASIALYIALPRCAGVSVARQLPIMAPKLVLPLGLLATVVFSFLLWKTAYCAVKRWRKSVAL
jgi:hypothetical protein